jgi:transcriptional regulator with XRE-family HTH domain
MTYGENIREAREEKGLTQKQLAEKLQISYVNISQLERNERVPNMNTLERIASALGVPVKRLFGREVEFEDIFPLGTTVELEDDELRLLREYRKADTRGKVNIRMVSHFESDYSSIKKSGIANPLEMGVNLPSIRKKDTPQPEREHSDFAGKTIGEILQSGDGLQYILDLINVAEPSLTGAEQRRIKKAFQTMWGFAGFYKAMGTSPVNEDTTLEALKKMAEV